MEEWEKLKNTLIVLCKQRTAQHVMFDYGNDDGIGFQYHPVITVRVWPPDPKEEEGRVCIVHHNPRENDYYIIHVAPPKVLETFIASTLPWLARYDKCTPPTAEDAIRQQPVSTTCTDGDFTGVVRVNPDLVQVMPNPFANRFVGGKKVDFKQPDRETENK